MFGGLNICGFLSLFLVRRVMLRKRSRPVTSKQALVADQSNLPKKPTPFFFNSPKIFKGFLTNPSSETEPMMNPTSIIDTKPFSAIVNSFWIEKKIPTTKTPKTLSSNKHSWDQTNNKKGICLALIDENHEPNNSFSKQQKSKLVVFGSQLKIQLPSSSVFPCFSPESPKEFGIKTPRPNLCQVFPEESIVNGNLTVEENLSMIEMEKSEDYTCVISHGPNPKTTHIFGNSIVESCCGVDGSSSFSSRKNGYLSSLGNSIPLPENFLSFCHHCKKQLGQGKDIYMYRGEKAFCSQECRCQEMLFDGVEK